jgi:hypothetical protein
VSRADRRRAEDLLEEFGLLDSLLCRELCRIG